MPCVGADPLLGLLRVEAQGSNVAGLPDQAIARRSHPRRFGRRTTLTFPLLPPPQKSRSPPSDSSPETLTPGGISSVSRICPVRGSTRLKSLLSPSQVACQSSPSTQVTPVTKRLDSMVRRIAPVWGSI